MGTQHLPNEMIFEIAKYLPVEETIEKIRLLNKTIYDQLSQNLKKMPRFKARVAYFQQVDFTYIDENGEPIVTEVEEFLKENDKTITLFNVLVIDASLSENDLTRRFLRSVFADVVLLVWTTDVWGFIRRDLWSCYDLSSKDPIMAALSTRGDRIANQTIEKGKVVATWIGKFLRRPRLYGVMIACVERLQYFAVSSQIRLNFNDLPTEFVEEIRIQPTIDSTEKFMALLKAYRNHEIVNCIESIDFRFQYNVLSEIWSLPDSILDFQGNPVFQKAILPPDAIKLTWRETVSDSTNNSNENLEDLYNKSPFINVIIEGCSTRETEDYQLLKTIFKDYL